MLSAKLFLDEVRTGAAGVPKAALYQEPPSDLTRCRTERDEAYSQRVEERDSSMLVLRKRSRDEDQNMEKERNTRQRRVYDPGLAVLPVGSHIANLKRTHGAFGNPPLVRRILSSSSRTRDVNDRKDAQAASSNRAFAPNPNKHESRIPRFSPKTKSNPKKHSSQHFAAHGRTPPSDGRYSSPRPDSHPCVPQRFDEAAEKFVVTKTSASPSRSDPHLKIRASLSQEHGSREDSISRSNRKTQTRFAKNQRLGRLDFSEPSSGHKKPKKMVVRTPGKGQESPLDKSQESPLGKSQQTPLQQKGPRSVITDGSLKVVRTTPQKAVKPRVIRLSGSNAGVSRCTPKTGQSELENDKDLAFELQPTESSARIGEKNNIPGVKQDEKTQRLDVPQLNVGDGEFCHDEVDLTKQCQIGDTDLHGERTLTDVNGLSQLQLPELPVPSPLQYQNLLPSSECRSEAPRERSASPLSSQSIMHNQPFFNTSETSLAPFRQHEIGSLHSEILSGRSSPLGMALPSNLGCHEMQPLVPVMQQLEGSLNEEPVPSLLYGDILQPSEHTEIDFMPLNLHVDLAGEACEANQSRLLNEYLPVIPEIQSLSQPFKELTPTAAREIESYQCLDVLSLCDIQSTSGLTPSSERPAPLAVIENQSFLCGPAPAFLDKMSETTAEREVRLFGKSLKASVAEMSIQPHEALPASEVTCHRSAKQAFSMPDLHSEQRDTLAGSPIVVSPDIGLPTVDSSKTRTCTPEALPMKPEPRPSVGQDRQVDVTPSKQFSMVTHHPRGRIIPKPAHPGAHTWHRPMNGDGLKGSQALSKAIKGSAVSSALVKQKASQLASYVRKGNSLVRAPISSTPAVYPVVNTGLSHGPGKDTSGKSFSLLGRSQRMYPAFQNAIRNTKGTFRKVFWTPKMPLNESIGGPTSSENLQTAPHALDNSILQDSQGAGFSHALAKATRPRTPEVKTNLFVESAMDDDQLQQNMQNLRSSHGESLPDDGEPATLEASSQMLNVVTQPKSASLGTGCAALKDSEACLTYVKNKANQLIASVPSTSLGLTRAEGQISLAQSGPTGQDLYYKRKNNQIVRNGTKTKDASMRLLQGPLVKRGATLDATKGRACTISQTALGKALRQKQAYPTSSWVWKLNSGATSQGKGVLPLIFPWKRPGLGAAVRAGRFKALPKAKKGSLLFLISKRLQRLRKLQPVYTRSAHGFSLHRSGVLSLSGANLKWTKSIEKRSKLASEEATKAVAAVEKKRREEKEAVSEVVNAVARAKAERRAARGANRGNKRCLRERVIMVGLVRYKMDASRRTLQRMPDQQCGDLSKTLSAGQNIDSTLLSTPRRLSIGGIEYVQVGNGQQLVRDPKSASRALASEKVRWSLHTARFRRAKKQQYCLFFTRFGKCNKGEGECPYIHDPEKVAVCTKFLKGTCSGTNCLLTHKVIPERMPDCSFFLEGLCTNEDCPYRHVSVNPKAPICEGFLKGYCVDGDECNKKHTSVCPSFTATGECSDRSTCKLHHPEKKVKRVLSVKSGRGAMKRKRRYFVTGSLGLSEQGRDLSQIAEERRGTDCTPVDSDGIDFIGLPNIDIELDLIESDDFKRKFASMKEHLPLLQDDFHREEDDIWIKPVLLLQRPADAVSS